MNSAIDLAVCFFGSGLAFFVGIGCLFAALGMSAVVARRLAILARNSIAFVGVVLLTTCAAPLASWVYVAGAVVVVAWMACEWRRAKLRQTTLRAARGATLAVCVLGLALETPYHLMPTWPPLDRPTVFVIGDSISAGMSESDRETWPKRLADQQGVVVRDYSRMGATVKSARSQAEKLGDAPGFVLLEIGGNDLLGTTSADAYEQGLEALLREVRRDDRTVVMFALPLPPFANRFGRVQRRLAAQYGVRLLPPRVLVGLLTEPGATVDGIHLTPTGHQRMADAVWSFLRPSFANARSD